MNGNAERLSVLSENLLLTNRLKAVKLRTVMVFFFHINSGNTLVVVGGVVHYSFIAAVAIGVKRDFIFSIHIAAASGLGNRTENMEELRNAFRLAACAHRVHFRKSRPHKSGFTGKVARKPQCAHSPAVSVKRNTEFVFRILRRKVHIVA